VRCSGAGCSRAKRGFGPGQQALACCRLLKPRVCFSSLFSSVFFLLLVFRKLWVPPPCPPAGHLSGARAALCRRQRLHGGAPTAHHRGGLDFCFYGGGGRAVLDTGLVLNCRSGCEAQLSRACRVGAGSLMGTGWAAHGQLAPAARHPCSALPPSASFPRCRPGAATTTRCPTATCCCCPWQPALRVRALACLRFPFTSLF
jgi:hypothetical protein